MRAQFDFYGLVVEVESVADALIREVSRDFSYFARPDVSAGPGFRIALEVGEPGYAGLPPVPAAFLTPRNVCFRAGPLTYIDYFGRALAVFDRRAGSCVVRGPDPELLHEITYLLLLSTVGQHLDQRGVHRIHALGVSHRGRGVLLLLPSGGGKSTMALRLLGEPDFLLLGEDTPLVDAAGRILPFPLRLGVRPGQALDVPAQHIRTVRRMEFDPKTLIDIDYFRDRLGSAVPAGMVLVGERNLGEVSEIVPLARARALRAIVKYLVVGLGVYQGMEFVLERGLGDLAGKVGVASSRLRAGLGLLARAPAYRFVLGRDLARNQQTLL